MQFRAKSAKNDLKPTYFLKHSFYFETEGVVLIINYIYHFFIDKICYWFLDQTTLYSRMNEYIYIYIFLLGTY